jgi:chromosome segregation ATPase
MNQPDTMNATAPAGIPLEQLVGVSASQERIQKSARESKAASVRAGITRMRAELDAVKDERDYLRAEMERFSGRMDRLEATVREVAATLHRSHDAQGDHADVTQARLVNLEASVQRLIDAFLPDEEAEGAEVQAPDLTKVERVRRWVVALFRDDEEYYVN